MFALIFSSQGFDVAVNEIITKIKNGDQELKNRFIDHYKPFIIKSVSKVVGNKYIEIENSEEFSIGLTAFDEAINCYDESKSRNFFGFARQVIKRRIINYWAGNQKNIREYPFSYFQKDNPDYIEKIPQPGAGFTQNYEIKEEVQLFKERLAGFGVTLKELVSRSPKHKDSKLLAMHIAGIISNDDNLYKQMMKYKALPMVELLKITNVSKRTIERHRKFIIAICLILRSELEILKEYIYQAERGRK